MGMMELKSTEMLMNSADYRERLIAEYWQTKIRYEKLKDFNTRIEAAQATDRCLPVGVVDNSKRVEMPKHDCPEYLLIEQQRVMGEYLHILEIRAVIEGISLENPFDPPHFIAKRDS